MQQQIRPQKRERNVNKAKNEAQGIGVRGGGGGGGGCSPPNIFLATPLDFRASRE